MGIDRASGFSLIPFPIPRLAASSRRTPVLPLYHSIPPPPPPPPPCLSRLFTPSVPLVASPIPDTYEIEWIGEIHWLENFHEPRAAAAPTRMLTRQSQPSISRSFDCQFHYHIVSSRIHFEHPSWDQTVIFFVKEERKRRIKSAKAHYFLNIAKIFVKIRFKDDIFLREERIFLSFVIPRVETRSFFFFSEKRGRNVVFKISIREANLVPVD